MQFGRESTSGPRPSQVDYPAGVGEIRLAMTREQTPIPNTLCRSLQGRTLSFESQRKPSHARLLTAIIMRPVVTVEIVTVENRRLRSQSGSMSAREIFHQLSTEGNVCDVNEQGCTPNTDAPNN